MPKPRRRPMYYYVRSLRDGTVLGSYPVRKPAPAVMKRDRLRIDQDGVAIESSSNGQEFRNADNRCRFWDIIAANLNTRRAIRELVLPAIAELRSEVAALRADLSGLVARP